MNANIKAEVELSEFLTFRLARLQAKLNSQAAHLLRQEAGLTLIQWRIIALIGQQPSTTASKVTGTGILDKGLFSRNLKTLSADGLVAITADPNDSRIQNLSLTAKGRKIFQTTLPKTRARQQALRANLTVQENEMLNSILDKLDAASELREF